MYPSSNAGAPASHEALLYMIQEVEKISIREPLSCFRIKSIMYWLFFHIFCMPEQRKTSRSPPPLGCTHRGSCETAWGRLLFNSVREAFWFSLESVLYVVLICARLGFTRLTKTRISFAPNGASVVNLTFLNWHTRYTITTLALQIIRLK